MDLLGEARSTTPASFAAGAKLKASNSSDRLWTGDPTVGQVLTFPLDGGDRTVIGVVDNVPLHALAERCTTRLCPA